MSAPGQIHHPHPVPYWTDEDEAAYEAASSRIRRSAFGHYRNPETLIRASPNPLVERARIVSPRPIAAPVTPIPRPVIDTRLAITRLATGASIPEVAKALCYSVSALRKRLRQVGYKHERACLDCGAPSRNVQRCEKCMRLRKAAKERAAYVPIPAGS